MRETLEKRKVVEKIPEQVSGIVEEHGVSFATLDGVNKVAIPKELAQNISTALRMQDKIDNAILRGNRPGLLEMVAVLNCRKAISAVTDSVPLKSLLRQKNVAAEHVTPESTAKASGIPQLKKDMNKILQSGELPVLGSNEDMGIESHLEGSQVDLPAVVHVFEIPQQNVSAIMSRLFNNPTSLNADQWMKGLALNHTFLVLGKIQKGKYLCFQKVGPDIMQPFELRDLQSLTELTLAPRPEKMYLSFIGSTKNLTKEQGAEETKEAA
ncbi:MAG TPA: hypothetical protein VI483_01920 [Candidatus Paceibacterota bacterium]